MPEAKRFKPLPSNHPALVDIRAEGARMHLEILEHRLKSDPSVSNWLKEQLQSTRERDIVDALNDVETLHNILQLRLTSITKTPTGK